MNPLARLKLVRELNALRIEAKVASGIAKLKAVRRANEILAELGYGKAENKSPNPQPAQDTGPTEGDVNAEGLVFRCGRWHRNDKELPRGTIYGDVKEIGELADKVLAGSIPGNVKAAIRYQAVTRQEAAALKDSTGFDLAGFEHAVDSFSIYKVLKDHGGKETESPRGQIPITKDDWMRIPEIVLSYDHVENAGKDATGNDLIRYVKGYPDGLTRYVEEIRNKRGELAAKTMWKTRTASANAEPLPTPPAPTSETSGRNLPHVEHSIATNGGGKEPWEMTRDEYAEMERQATIQYWDNAIANTKSAENKAMYQTALDREIANEPDNNEDRHRIHRNIVKNALIQVPLSQIPARVLADYPDLKPALDSAFDPITPLDRLKAAQQANANRALS